MAISEQGRRQAREQLSRGGIKKSEISSKTKKYNITLNVDIMEALEEIMKMKRTTIIQLLLLEKAREEGIL
jgi:hypothetical protein